MCNEKELNVAFILRVTGRKILSLFYLRHYCVCHIQWVPKLFNKVYFQFFSVAVNVRKNPNSDWNRGNCFQQGFEQIKILTQFPKTGFPENQNPSFSAPRRPENYFVLTT